jgi:integrase
MLSERDLGRNIDSTKQTLNQYLDRWLEVCARPRLRAKSFLDYEGLLRRHIRPQLGTKPLACVQAFDIQGLYRDLLDRGLSPRTIRYTHTVLGSAVKQAVRWKLLLTNPAQLVDLPRQTRLGVGVLTVEQARAFIRAIAGHPYEALFALAMTTGMRPSEYLALTWADIDFVYGVVRVSRTLEWGKGGWHFDDTKRVRSRRAIKLQSWVIDLLEQRRQRTAPQHAAGSAQDLVFVAKRGGPIRESRFARRHFKPLLRSTGLPDIRLYDLRHTAATLSLAAGVSPKVVSEQLGHASVAFTLDVYSHLLPHMQEAAAAKVEALLRGPE